MTRDLRDAVYRHIAHLPLGYFQRTKTGQIISRVITRHVRDAARSDADRDAVAADQRLIVSYIAFLFLISWKLTLMALVIVPVLGLVLSRSCESCERAIAGRATSTAR